MCIRDRLNPGGEGDRWLSDAELVLQSMIDQEASQASPDPMPITDDVEAEPTS